MENWVKILNVACSLFLYIAEGINNSIIGPFFPIEASEKGISQATIGIIGSIFNVSNLFACFVMILITKPETQKIYFCTGASISALANLAFGYLSMIENTNIFIACCIVARVLMGIGASMLWATGVPILLPIYPKLAGRITSLVQSSIALGLMAGPPIGSLLYKIGGYTLPFTVAGATETAVSIICILALPSAASQRQLVEESGIERSTMDRTVGKFATRPGILMVTISMIVITSSLGYMSVALALHLQQTFGIDGDTSGLYFLVFSGASAISSPFYGMLVDRGHAGKLFCYSTISTTVSYVLLALPKFLPQLETKVFLFFTLATIGGSISAAFTGVYLVLEKTALSYGIRDRNKIKLMTSAWISSCFSVGCTEGGMFVGGVFYQWYGFYNSAILQAALTLATGLVGSAYITKSGLCKNIYYETGSNEKTKLLSQSDGDMDGEAGII